MFSHIDYNDDISLFEEKIMVGSAAKGQAYSFPGESYLSIQPYEGALPQGYNTNADLQQCAYDWFRAGDTALFFIDGQSVDQLKKQIEEAAKEKAHKENKPYQEMSPAEKLTLIWEQHLLKGIPKELHPKFIEFFSKYLHQGAVLSSLDGAFTFKANTIEEGSYRHGVIREVHFNSASEVGPMITVEEIVRVTNLYAPGVVEPILSAPDNASFLEGRAFHEVSYDTTGEINLKLKGVNITSYHEKATELLVSRDQVVIKLKGLFEKFNEDLNKSHKKLGDLTPELTGRKEAIDSLLAILNNKKLFINDKLVAFATQFKKKMPALRESENFLALWKSSGNNKIDLAESLLKQVGIEPSLPRPKTPPPK